MSKQFLSYFIKNPVNEISYVKYHFLLSGENFSFVQWYDGAIDGVMLKVIFSLQNRLE